MKSKFLKTIREYRDSLQLEDTSVSSNEESALPSDDYDDIDDLDDYIDPPEDYDSTDDDKQESRPSSFTDREVDILNVALQIIRDNPNYPIETKNELSNLFDENQHEALLSRLIGIADELI